MFTGLIIVLAVLAVAGLYITHAMLPGLFIVLAVLAGLYIRGRSRRHHH